MEDNINWFVIGITGVTCSGKTTLANKLKELIPRSHMISQDDYFLDVENQRHLHVPEINHIHFDVITALDMDSMCADIQRLLNKHNKEPITAKHEEHEQLMNCHCFDDLLKDLKELLNQKNYNVLIIEGFSIFQNKFIEELCHLKYFFTLNYEECKKRRNLRTYEPPDCPGYFEICVWPEYLKYLKLSKEESCNVIYMESNLGKEYYTNKVLNDIKTALTTR